MHNSASHKSMRKILLFCRKFKRNERCCKVKYQSLLVEVKH